MKKICILLSILTAFSMDAIAETTKKGETTPNQAKQEATSINLGLEQAVDEALKAVKAESPQVHEDALLVWKNFSSTSKLRKINFTYRVWGRRLILWLRDEKKIAFQSEEQVGDVFKVLWRKGLISRDAVVVLMVDAWAHLRYLEGAPSWEKQMENRSPQGGMVSNGSYKEKPSEQAV
ncbi:MAG: hypothetical protein K0R76_910 [Alphaproteobacteria bacterium]|jgi:hypothetical protein|nr:hypothetical protein [Alphaproteobacteria bacterium]